jgi:hypothetical protein
MSQDKLFDHLKKQMQDQQKQPSANAWHRMEQILETSAIPSKNKKWISLAASFLVFGLLAVGYFLLKPMVNNNVIPSTLNQPVVEISSEEISEQTSLKSIENTTQNTPKVYEKTTVNPINTLVLQEKNNRMKSHTDQTKNEILENPLPTEIKLNNNEVPENSIAENPSNPSKTSQVKINPNDLLQQVEKELNHEHRESKMDKIQRNIKALQEQLANRNQEN